MNHVEICKRKGVKFMQQHSTQATTSGPRWKQVAKPMEQNRGRISRIFWSWVGAAGHPWARRMVAARFQLCWVLIRSGTGAGTAGTAKTAGLCNGQSWTMLDLCKLCWAMLGCATLCRCWMRDKDVGTFRVEVDRLTWVKHEWNMN